MEELNKRLEHIEKDYMNFQKNQQSQQSQQTNTFDYKKMINDNIKKEEMKSNRLNSFLTDSNIYNQSNEFYDFDNNKKEDIFTIDNEVNINNNENKNKMNALLFTNYKTEIKNDIMNQQTGHVDGLMELPYLNKEGFTKNKKINKSMITNSRLNNYTPIGRNMNKLYDNVLTEKTKKNIQKEITNERLNQLNPMTTKNPLPLKYENKVSDMTKEYYNYNTQTEKELNTYYKKNPKKIQKKYK